MTLLLLSLLHRPHDPNRLPFFRGLGEPIAKIFETLFDVDHAHLISFRLGEALLYISRGEKASIPDAFVVSIHDLESKVDKFTALRKKD
ncbi:hypothetical protein [Stenotrophomonas hibiscicola]|uniref:hypothetical protein n=1 Tax=Stenotrophomonas hibiscicola TaxID=86189 RepID=UPI002E759C15|nr:hypothetical protein [[Pseudomonas] hibiscicola]